jgi:general L-amino acid transport system substrate-binding protein
MGDNVRLKKLSMLLLVLLLVLAACTPAAEDETAEPALPEDTDTEPGEDLAQDEPEEETEVAQAPSNGLLGEIQSRGTLQCGVNDAVPGFGSVDEDGNPVGFDIDFCRAVAAAVFGDAEAVDYRVLTAAERFTALQSGEIDVLIRNTTATATRDGSEGAAFATTTYYDGQGMMVREADGFGSIDDMTNTVVCVLEGTTTELNLATRFADIPYEPRTFTENDDLQEAFIAEACDGWTSDVSQLSARRSTFPDEAGGPDSLVIFEEVFSKEPLGPAVRDGDSEWFDAVNWTVMATIQAEEFGITSENIDEFMETDNADIQRFLGLPVGDEQTVFDPGLGLPTDFVEQIIRQVGSYGEIYDRHLGPDTPLNLPRVENALWTEGGLLYAWPYR